MKDCFNINIIFGIIYQFYNICYYIPISIVDKCRLHINDYKCFLSIAIRYSHLMINKQIIHKSFALYPDSLLFVTSLSISGESKRLFKRMVRLLIEVERLQEPWQPCKGPCKSCKIVDPAG